VVDADGEGVKAGAIGANRFASRLSLSSANMEKWFCIGKRMMNLKATSETPSRTLHMTLVLETLASGNVAASILEFPQYRVEAQNRESAIAQIREGATDLLSRIEFLPLEIPTEKLDSPWIKYAGMFQDDPDFAEIAAAMRAERSVEDDTEVDPSVYAIEG
jgi:hypothetical protein